MLDVNKMKALFPFFKYHPEHIYLDSAATSLKPQVVLDKINDYYLKYSTNTHNTDSDLAYDTMRIMTETRELAAKFINAKDKKEVIFVSGTTFGLNQIAYGLKEQLQKGDEIFITYYEHSSNILPWYRLAKEKEAVIKFIPFDKQHNLLYDEFASMLSSKTKIVSFANITNVLNNEVDVKKVNDLVKKHNSKALVVVDCAQSVLHKKIDVQQWGVDFVTFSAHKMFGPTGIGILWGKEAILSTLEPLVVGGGMNSIIEKSRYTTKDIPDCLEAGTPNVEGIFGLNAAIKFINEITLEKIQEHEKTLKKYAVEQFKLHLSDKVTLYNDDNPNPTVIFNVKDKFAQDVATHLGTMNNITLRSGEHCAKLLDNVLDCAKTIRASFTIYNSKSDIDALVKALKEEKDFLGRLI